MSLFIYILAFIIAFIKGLPDFTKEFTSDVNSYLIQNSPEKDIYRNENDLFVREKCKTCCRVMFVSEYNFKRKRQFKNEDDLNGDIRFAMDMEFDDKRSIRMAEGNYEQCILARPLNKNNELQYFELNSYKMINMFSSPKRVHDIRSGIVVGNKLIIWVKKPALLASTNNQRFTYIYPYDNTYFNKMSDTYINYKKHFTAPYYLTDDVCYEVVTDEYQRWTGNQNLKVKGDNYQIKINKCSNDPKQLFSLVYV